MRSPQPVNINSGSSFTLTQGWHFFTVQSVDPENGQVSYTMGGTTVTFFGSLTLGASPTGSFDEPVEIGAISANAVMIWW